MARTPFFSRITSAGATYTVPAGKVAICNVYYSPATISLGGLAFGPEVKFSVNGTPVCALTYSNTFRHGPFVFNAGDVISTLGTNNNPSTAAQLTLNGFLYNQSSVKVPLGQKLTRASSYTVPANKYIVVNFFAGIGLGLIKIDGTPMTGTGDGESLAPTLKGQAKIGPFTALASQVISVATWVTDSDVFPAVPPGGGDAVFMNGFLYNA